MEEKYKPAGVTCEKCGYGNTIIMECDVIGCEDCGHRSLPVLAFKMIPEVGTVNGLIPAPEPPRGLRASIYKDKGRDWSNGGLSSRVDEVTIIGDNIPPIFEATPDAPAVRVVVRHLFARKERYVHIEPQELGQYMMGGCFIHTSDSRFSEHVNRYPVALHDRVELPARDEMRRFAHAPGPAKIRV